MGLGGRGRRIQQAIALNPNYSTTQHWYPILLTAAGRFEESLSRIERALAIEPMSLMINSTRGWILFYAGRHQEAIEQFRKTIAMEPGFCTAHWLLGFVHEAAGQFDDAIGEFREALRLDPTPAILSSLGHALAVAGRADEAREALASLERMSAGRYVPPESRALVHLGLGEHESALDWFERALEERSTYLVLILVDPRLGPLRRHARFGRIVKSIGFSS